MTSAAAAAAFIQQPFRAADGFQSSFPTDRRRRGSSTIVACIPQIFGASSRSSHADDKENMSSESDNARRNFIKDTFLFGCGSFTAAAASGLAHPAFAATTTYQEERQKYYFDTAKDIPDSYIESHQYLYGYVEKVSDGDTIRIRHVPNVDTFLKNEAVAATTTTTSKKRLPLSNTTIVVRMYGVDAPETAKTSSEVSQPFGEDAKQLTKDLIYHKLVAVKLLRRDKYHRIVGAVETCVTTTSSSSCVPKDVSVELISKGLATLYTGAGADYNGNKELLQQRLQAAQRYKLGIWSLGEDLVTPAEYKRKKKLAEQQQPQEASYAQTN